MAGTQYATLTELVTLGVPAAALTGITDPTRTAALIAASNVVDSYVGARFKLPLTSYGADLTIAVCKMAAYTLITSRGISPGNDTYEALRNAYQDAMKWLSDISTGKSTPAWPVAKDVNSYNPEGTPFVLQPASNSVADPDGICVEDGTPIRPRLRGW